MAPLLRVPRAVLPAPALLLAPTSPAHPPPPSGRLWVGCLTPAPCQTPDLALSQKRSSSCIHHLLRHQVVTTAWAAGRPYICPRRKLSQDFCTQCPKCTVADLNLFKEEISWKGEAGGNVRPLKAMVLWVTTMHPPPRLHHSPNQLRATTIWVPVVGRHG